MIPRFLSVPAILLFSIQTLQAQISISDARLQGTGTVTVRGVVTTGPELGLIRYLQDGTAGIAAYPGTGSVSISSIVPGDSIEITGTLKQFNNLLEIDPVSSFTVISSGNNLPAPLQLSLSAAFTEQYEGMLVQLSNVTKSGGAGTFAGQTNYPITDGSVTKELRVVGTTDIPGKAAPGSAFGIIGIISQFNTIYQILPRSYADLLLPGPRISGKLLQDSITTTSFRVSFSTQATGTTIIRYGLTTALELGSITDFAMLLNHSGKISGLSPATFYYVKAVSIDANGDSSASSTVLMSTASLSSGGIKAYFTQTVDTSVATFKYATHLNQSVDDTLIAYINRAKSTIDLALYNFNNSGLSDITAALNNAHGRGVRVRIVADGGTAMNGLTTLNTAIKYILSPQSSSYSIMHNKFVVFDAASTNPEDAIVWTGGTNLTSGQINTDVNNVVIIYDQSVAKAYSVEFEEMFGSNTATPNSSVARFGQFKTDNTPHEFNVGGKRVEVFFSPSDGTNNRIIEGVKSAQNDLFFECLVFTRTDVATAIRDQVLGGVYGAGIVNDTSGGGVPFNIIKPAMGSNQLVYSKAGTMHSKMGLFDANASSSDPTVLTGSHNWSTAADTRNDENTVVIHDDTIANIFYQEFSRRFKDETGTPLKGFANCKTVKPVVMANHPAEFHNLSTPAYSKHSYTWEFGDTYMGNDKDQIVTHIYQTPADYAVLLYLIDTVPGVGVYYDSATCFVTVIADTTTGISKSISAIKQISIYPNPAKDEVTLSFENLYGDSYSAEITDLRGRILSDTKLAAVRGLNEQTVSLRGLKDGLYLLRIYSANESAVIKLMIAR
jgi:phosphatidylserine/phosphatidylglycerophosphate/cardiolipin synthase-like enzyme